MSAASSSDRRKFLLAALAATGGGLALLARRGWLGGGGAWPFGEEAPPEPPLPPGVRDAARRLGEACRRRVADADFERLWRRLERDLGPWPAAGLDEAGFRTRVQERIAGEFARGAWVEVEGWRLAETEVALFGLAAAATP